MGKLATVSEVRSLKLEDAQALARISSSALRLGFVAQQPGKEALDLPPMAVAA
jgi:hypothetical protein